MKNKIEDLRDHLFEAIEMLKSGDTSMTIEKAKTISDLSQTIINSAKVEVDFIRATQRTGGTEFLDNKARTELPAPRMLRPVNQGSAA